MANKGIPPNGFMGNAQQSIAVQNLVAGAMGRSTPARTRRKTTRRKKRRVAKRRSNGAPRKRRASPARGKKPARLVKGSAAAKRHMAKLRKMQRRRR